MSTESLSNLRDELLGVSEDETNDKIRKIMELVLENLANSLENAIHNNNSPEGVYHLHFDNDIKNHPVQLVYEAVTSVGTWLIGQNFFVEISQQEENDEIVSFLYPEELEKIKKYKPIISIRIWL